MVLILVMHDIKGTYYLVKQIICHMTPNKNNNHVYSSNKNALEPSTVLTMIVWHMDEPSFLMKTHFREETIIYLKHMFTNFKDNVFETDIPLQT